MAVTVEHEMETSEVYEKQGYAQLPIALKARDIAEDICFRNFNHGP